MRRPLAVLMVVAMLFVSVGISGCGSHNSSGHHHDVAKAAVGALILHHELKKHHQKHALLKSAAGGLLLHHELHKHHH